MRASSIVSLLAALFLLALLPALFAQIMAVSLVKLHLTPGTALALMLAMFLGGAIDVPVRRIARREAFTIDPFTVFGLAGPRSRFARGRQETVIAVNVGGCVIPTGIALYEFARLAAIGTAPVAAALLACIGDILVCFVVARPVPGIGILMPAFLPAGVAAVLALLLAPEQTAPVAFVAGTLGPLLGADFLHLRDIEKSAVGMASIGGAGTFDGIVLSGIVAAYLA